MWGHCLACAGILSCMMCGYSVLHDVRAFCPERVLVFMELRSEGCKRN